MAVVVIAWPLAKTDGPATSAKVQLRTLESGSQRAVQMTARLDPPDAADRADWVDVIAWQGGGLVLNRPKEIAPGVFRSTEPIPVHGEWKAGLRIADGRALRTLPLYMPADAAIPAPRVPARAEFTRALVPDKEFLQREARDGSAWLTLPAYLVLASLMGGLLLLAWALHRVRRPAARRTPAGAPLRSRAGVEDAAGIVHVAWMATCPSEARAGCPQDLDTGTMLGIPNALGRPLGGATALVDALRVLPEIAENTAAMAKATRTLPKIERRLAEIEEGVVRH